MSQVVQIIGSVLVLLASALSQRGALSTTSLRYPRLNVAGSTALAVDVVVVKQRGFLLLEGVRALVPAVSLSTYLRRRARVSAGPDGSGR